MTSFLHFLVVTKTIFDNFLIFYVLFLKKNLTNTIFFTYKFLCFVIYLWASFQKNHIKIWKLRKVGSSKGRLVWWCTAKKDSIMYIILFWTLCLFLYKSWWVFHLFSCKYLYFWNWLRIQKNGRPKRKKWWENKHNFHKLNVYRAKLSGLWLLFAM